MATHGLLSLDAPRILEQSNIDEVSCEVRLLVAICGCVVRQMFRMFNTWSLHSFAIYCI